MIVFEGSTPETRARIRAHNAFDALWKSGRMKRREAYRWLAGAMGLPLQDTHISLFTPEQCDQVIALVEEAHDIGDRDRHRDGRAIRRNHEEDRHVR